MSDLPFIQLRNLTTGYRTRRQRIVASEHLNASLQTGVLTCLLGPNGAGKSTLLRTLTANLPPLQGEVLVNGKPVSAYTRQELSRLIGVVLTERVDVQGMTVREMVAMGRSPYTGFWGALTSEDESVIEQSMALAGMKDLASRQVYTLSDGERQKVMLAKALAQQTTLILLDEPTAFLDFPSKAETLLLLRQLAHQESRSILLSTHDLELALQIADQLWLMQPGQPLAIGTPRQLADNGSLARFLQNDHIQFDADTLRLSINSGAP